jgi:hypothetical protein
LEVAQPKVVVREVGLQPIAVESRSLHGAMPPLPSRVSSAHRFRTLAVQGRIKPTPLVVWTKNRPCHLGTTSASYPQHPRVRTGLRIWRSEDRLAPVLARLAGEPS